MTRDRAELELSGAPSTDAERITQYRNQQRSDRRFRRDLYFELDDHYNDFTGAYRALRGAEQRGAELPAAPADVAADATPGGKQQAAEEWMQHRSQEARVADRSRTAGTVTSDLSDWINRPGDVDFSGVDTLREDTRARRIEDAVDNAKNRGVVSRIEVRDELYGGSAAGEFNDGNAEIMVSRSTDRPHRTVAHELGHAIDFAVGDGDRYASDSVFDAADDSLVEDAAAELQDVWRERDRDMPLNPEYVNDPRELTADFAALAIEDPHRVEQRAPAAHELFSDAGVRDELLSAGAGIGPGEPRDGGGLDIDWDATDRERTIWEIDEKRDEIFRDVDATPEDHMSL